MKTQRERQEEKKREKLEHMNEQIESGDLQVRQMTAKERKANPPRERKPRSGRR